MGLGQRGGTSGTRNGASRVRNEEGMRLRVIKVLVNWTT